MGRVIHFEIHADDPQRAMRFYRELLGWTFDKWGDFSYWLAKTGPADEPGIDGALMPRDATLGREGIAAYVCTAAVADLDQALASARALGATVENDKRAVPGVGWHAYIRDTEGNLVGLMQEDETAGSGAA